MKRIQDLDIQGKKVLVRCDFNVPLSEDLVVLDDFRIKKTLPTIKYLLSQQAKIILMSHLGRPEGKIIESLRLDPVAKQLSRLLGQDVKKINDCVGSEVKDVINGLRKGEIILLENVQFNPGEKNNDPDFARQLASYADVFILEAFGQAHRDYASISGIQKYLSSAAGMLLEQEVNNLSKIIENPKKPLVVLIGGSKVSEKVELINKLSKTADFILLGGLIHKEIQAKNIQLDFPEKFVSPVDEAHQGRDLGEQTVALFKEKIVFAATIFFNGAMGQVEIDEYAKGTEEILKAIALSQAFSVLGGGDMTKVIKKLGLMDRFGHVSTGGGAMMEFLSGKKLPGIEALN